MIVIPAGSARALCRQGFQPRSRQATVQLISDKLARLRQVCVFPVPGGAFRRLAPGRLGTTTMSTVLPSTSQWSPPIRVARSATLRWSPGQSDGRDGFRLGLAYLSASDSSVPTGSIDSSRASGAMGASGSTREAGSLWLLVAAVESACSAGLTSADSSGSSTA